MRDTEPLPDDARSQSETIGVILLTAVVVIVVSTTGMFYLSSIDSTGDEPRFSVDGDFSRPNVTITHTGGNVVPAGEIRLVLSVNGSRENATTLDRQFEPGDRWRVNVSEYVDVSSESVVGVTVFHVPSESRKFGDEWTVGEERTPAVTPTRTTTPSPTDAPTETATTTPGPTPTATPTPTPTPTPEPDTTPPTVTVESPNGGETFAGGETVPIEWAASDDDSGVDSVELAYSTDNGSTWTEINTDGSDEWTVPEVNTTEALVRVSVTDRAGNAANNTSDATFTIDNADPTVTEVTAEATGGSGKITVSWNVSDNYELDNLTVELRNDTGDMVDSRELEVRGRNNESSIEFTGAESGSYTAVVIVEDHVGQSDQDEDTAEVKGGGPPGGGPPGGGPPGGGPPGRTN